VDKLSARSIEHQSNAQVEGVHDLKSAFRKAVHGGEPPSRCGNPYHIVKKALTSHVRMWITLLRLRRAISQPTENVPLYLRFLSVVAVAVT
jgi:hypothetical protein